MATVSAGPMSPRAVVEAFFKDWETSFVEAFDRWLDPDCLWQNSGFPDARGKAAIQEILDAYLAVSDKPYGRVEMISIATSGNKVLTERIDHLWGDHDNHHSIRIMGCLEVEGGRITRYADYTDPRPFIPGGH